VGLVGLVIVMLIAAFRRLVLYEAAYGFSRLRAYTHVFTIWLGLLLVAVVLLEVLHRERAMALGIVLASLGFIISLSLLNVDAFIVRQNIQREIRSAADKVYAQNRADLDTQYFMDLSEDAIPPLVSAFHARLLPASVKEKIGSALACKQYERERDQRKYPWQSFHFSRWNAEKAFQGLGKELDAYKIIDVNWPIKIKTPGGEEISCYHNYYD
jgi:hypothetical protein